MCKMCRWPLSAECTAYKKSEHCCSVLSQWVQGNKRNTYIQEYAINSKFLHLTVLFASLDSS